MSLLDQKVINFHTFLLRCKTKYNIIQELEKKTDKNINDLFQTKGERSEFVTQLLPTLLGNWEGIRTCTLLARSWYEIKEEKERKQDLDEFKKIIEECITKLQNFILFLNDNEKDVLDDMRTLGGYLTIFTGSYLNQSTVPPISS